MTPAPRLVPSLMAAAERTAVDSRFYLATVAGAAWLAGIGLAALVNVGAGFWLVMAAVAAAGAVALWPVGRAGLVLAGVAALALGGARAVAAAPRFDAGHVAFYNGAAEAVLRGDVAAEPDVGDTNRRLRVAARELVIDGQTRPVSGLVLVEAPRYPAIGYGASLSLSGELLSPNALNSPDYAAYLARQGITSVMRYPAVSVVGEASGRGWRRALLAVRERGRAALRASLPEPQASLLTGILLGDDSGLPRALEDAFQTTGMTHIIAISGFNIALIIALLDRLAAPLLPRRTGAVVIAAFIVLYTLLVGASASVVRAALMGITYLVGLRLMGRPTLALAGLFTAAFLMTLWNPLTLWDVGFQLSLSATLGLLLFGQPWTRRLRRGTAVLPPAVRRPATQLLGEGVVITLAAQVLTVPLLIYHFGALSLASLPANFLVLPAQPA
nr:ComEC/Rec2 family competence protein [Promineifilum sp.]